MGHQNADFAGLSAHPQKQACGPAPKAAAPRGWAMAALLAKIVGPHAPPKWGFGPPALAHGMPLAWPRATGEKTRAMRQMHAPQGNAPMAGALPPGLGPGGRGAWCVHGARMGCQGGGGFFRYIPGYIPVYPIYRYIPGISKGPNWHTRYIATYSGGGGNCNAQHSDGVVLVRVPSCHVAAMGHWPGPHPGATWLSLPARRQHSRNTVVLGLVCSTCTHHPGVENKTLAAT